jgi:Protein of unknown function (DUF3276)
MIATSRPAGPVPAKNGGVPFKSGQPFKAGQPFKGGQPFKSGQSFKGGRSSEKTRQKPKIIHQTFFKSVGPRTYAAQVKELSNGNHLLALTEGRRDETTGELRKLSLFVFAEDFPAFFKMVKESSDFIAAHPLPDEVRKRRAQFWAKKEAEASQGKGKPAAAPGSAMKDSKAAAM